MNSEIKIKLLVCVHKEGHFLDDDNYMPIHVGKAISHTDLNIQGDDMGDNISDKNRNYCELTALYWAWKNLTGIDYIGLCHYRRYFNFAPSFFQRRDKYVIQLKDLGIKQELPDIPALFREYDMLLPKPFLSGRSLRRHYCVFHNSSDYDILRQVISELTPGYMKAFDELMDNTNRLMSYNMFLTTWECFDHYCNWLFKILFEVEKRIEISGETYQARVFGFMSERLLNVYCYHHRLKIKYYPIDFLGDSCQKDKSFIDYYRQRIKVSVKFYSLKFIGKIFGKRF